MPGKDHLLTMVIEIFVLLRLCQTFKLYFYEFVWNAK